MAVSTPQESFLEYRSRKDVQEFITQHIIPLPRRRFRNRSKSAINRLVKFLQSSEIKYSVKEVFKGGSLAKGTSIQQGADIDLVLFLNDFTSVTDVANGIQEITKYLSGVLGNRKGITVTHCTPHAVQFTKSIRNIKFDFDLLPNYDIVGEKGINGAYKEVISMKGTEEFAFYHSCFAAQQAEFVGSQLESVKRLIRLLKYWKKTHMESATCRKVPSFVMELLAIHVWEEGGSRRKFDIRMGLKAAMQQLANPSSINVSWKPEYAQLCEIDRGRPFIQDPGNPLNNVGLYRSSSEWEEVASYAQEALNSPLLRSISSWKRK